MHLFPKLSDLTLYFFENKLQLWDLMQFIKESRQLKVFTLFLGTLESSHPPQERIHSHLEYFKITLKEGGIQELNVLLQNDFHALTTFNVTVPKPFSALDPLRPEHFPNLQILHLMHLQQRGLSDKIIANFLQFMPHVQIGGAMSNIIRWRARHYPLLHNRALPAKPEMPKVTIPHEWIHCEPESGPSVKSDTGTHAGPPTSANDIRQHTTARYLDKKPTQAKDFVFKFKGKNKEKNQEMIIEKLLQYCHLSGDLEKESWHLWNDGICAVLCTMFCKMSFEDWRAIYK